jgi:hypothetical protein
MTSWIVLLGLLQSAPSPKERMERIESMTITELEAQSQRAQGGERGIVHLFLAINDSAHGASLDLAWPVLDSAYRANPTPLNATLLGTADALQARRCRQDVIAATRWVGKAIEHLDAAVAGDSTDISLRIFRIHSLVEVPEIFHVDWRLRQDEAMLRSRFSRMASADASALLALAAVDYRFGKLTEACAFWKLVASRKSASEPQRATARHRLESIRG